MKKKRQKPIKCFSKSRLELSYHTLTSITSITIITVTGWEPLLDTGSSPVKRNNCCQQFLSFKKQKGSMIIKFYFTVKKVVTNKCNKCESCWVVVIKTTINPIIHMKNVVYCFHNNFGVYTWIFVLHLKLWAVKVTFVSRNRKSVSLWASQKREFLHVDSLLLS